jgi:hypothetical protein
MPRWGPRERGTERNDERSDDSIPQDEAFLNPSSFDEQK